MIDFNNYVYNDDIEVWIEVDDYPLYEISDHGNVRRKDTFGQPTPKGYKSKSHGHEIKWRINNTGYAQVILHNKYGKKQFMVSKLVANHFIFNDDPELKVEVDHKFSRLDNRACALQHCTHSENVR